MKHDTRKTYNAIFKRMLALYITTLKPNADQNYFTGVYHTKKPNNAKCIYLNYSTPEDYGETRRRKLVKYTSHIHVHNAFQMNMLHF